MILEFNVMLKFIRVCSSFDFFFFFFSWLRTQTDNEAVFPVLPSKNT